MKNYLKIFIVIFSLFVTANSAAALIQWTAASGGNDHWYDIVSSGTITWTDANATAQGMGGYLATITSGDENTFVFNNLANDSTYWNVYPGGAWIGPWLGGYQPDPNSSAAAGWEWVTGEAWSYTNWHSPEPNDAGGSESFLHYIEYGGISALWNDLGENSRFSPVAFIIEYNTDPTVVPLPAAFWLLGSGLLGLFGFSRHKRVSR